MSHRGMPPLFGSSRVPRWRRVALAAVALVLTSIGPAAAATSVAGSAEALHRAWAADAASTKTAPGPAAGLRVESNLDKDLLTGRLLGVIERPLAEIQATLADPAGWCAVLILDPNIHTCRTADATIEATLGETSTRVTFTFAATAPGEGYVGSRIFAADGPLGSRDYAVTFEATPLAPTRTLVQLTFTQRFGVAGRMAMAAYFATSGRKKVGFTVVDRDAEGQPVYIGDLRGGIERNLARYFLAIEANASSRGVAPAQQPEARVRAWLAGTERYARQLGEGPGFFERKLPEVRKQMTGE